ncbi:MAG: phosphotransferase [bacterium]|nr:phosphotransferase [bacterium]
MTRGIEAAEIRARGFRLRVAPEYEIRCRQSGLVDARSCDALHASAPRIPGGRSENYLLEGTTWGDSIRLRPSRRGGWLAPLLGDRFLSPKRALREFDKWLDLRSQGVSLPQPVLAMSRRRGVFWRSSLATRELPQAQDGARWLGSRPGDAALFATGKVLARALRQFHDAGAIHGDLHLRNILFETGDSERVGGAPRCWLIDLDRTRIRDRVTPADRMREWMRLARSIEKRGLAKEISPRLRARLLRAYCDGDRSLRRAMLECVPREIRRTARHRFAWSFRRRFHAEPRKA